MRYCKLTLFILLVYSSGAGLSAMQDSSAAKFSVSVNLVKVPISIFDESGRMVTDLRREHFRVWEDKTLQEIRSFGLDTKPVSVVLLLDTSGTEIKDRDKIKDAAKEFTRILSHGDRVCVITFDENINLVQDWTDDMKEARKAIDGIRSGSLTALYDAMYLVAKEQLQNIEGRKAVVLLTDCVNNFSRVNFREASLKIVQSQASLYVISKTVLIRKEAKKQRNVIILNDIYKRLFGDEQNYIDEYFDRKETEMTELAEKTGGRCFFPGDYDEIKKDYSEIAREMKSKYYLTYVSNQDLLPDTYHQISIEYLKPCSRMTYRKGYYYQPRIEQRPRVLEPALE